MECVGGPIRASVGLRRLYVQMGPMCVVGLIRRRYKRGWGLLLCCAGCVGAGVNRAVKTGASLRSYILFTCETGS